VKSVLLGAGPRTLESAAEYPGYLREHGGRVMLELSLESVGRVSSAPIVIFREVDERAYHLSSIVSQIDPRARTLALRAPTAGAACTALMAIDMLDLDDELLIVNLTDYADVDLREPLDHFRRAGASAGTLVFESLHPRYSYVAIEDGEVRQVAEKNPISRHATAGIYWFESAALFLESAKSMIIKRAAVDHLYYVAPTLNEVILAGKRVSAFEIDSSQYVEMKSAGSAHVSGPQKVVDR
jgi:dTDP-glucose pyrophosphorylase